MLLNLKFELECFLKSSSVIYKNFLLRSHARCIEFQKLPSACTMWIAFSLHELVKCLKFMLLLVMLNIIEQWLKLLPKQDLLCTTHITHWLCGDVLNISSCAWMHPNLVIIMKYLAYLAKLSNSMLCSGNTVLEQRIIYQRALATCALRTTIYHLLSQ